MGLRLCALVIVLVGVAHAEPTPQQKIAMTAKPSVVRVWGAYVATYDLAGQKVQEAIGGSGTGFFITADGYIATNAHVVSDVKEGDEAAKKELYDTLLRDIQKKYGAELARMTQDQIRTALAAIKLVDLQKRAYVVLPNGDKLDYEVKQFGKPGSGRDVAIIKVKTENAPALPIGDSKRTQVADQIVVIGYPGVADMRELLDEKSQLQASVTDGSVSSLKNATSGEQILQISAPITHGNSGGPALDMAGNVIGLATFGNESEIQGFNFLVASATLKELVKDEKLDLKPSETLKLWRQGLDHYWRDEYSPAIENFRDVETMFPAHSEASGLIKLSNQAKKEGKEKKVASAGGGNGGLIAGLVIGGIVLIGVVLLLVTRRGKKGRPQQPHMQPPHMAPQQQMYGRVPPPNMGAPGQPMGAPGQQMGAPGQHMGAQVGPPQMPPPQMQSPQMHMGAPQMPPHMAAAGQPVAKTVAIARGPDQSGGIAPTAFGSLSIGSLTCTRGPMMGQRFALTATGIIIGRQPGVAHILVNDHRASGKHVWIGIDQGRLVAIDQGTTNGTYINDVARGRITRQELRDGDVVIVSEPDCCSLQIRLGQ